MTIRLPGSAETNTVTVPIAAITDRGRGPGVWVLNEKASTVSFRPVKVVGLGDEDAALSEGVHPGEQIVALGAHLLSGGPQVRVVAEKAAIQ